MKRRGFTLVELLVVISIIGVLVALLIPAVMVATSNARALRCRNRLKQLSLALLSYESRKDRFPGYLNSLELEIGNERAASWAVELMPELERKDVLEKWKRNDVADGDLPRPFIDILDLS